MSDSLTTYCLLHDGSAAPVLVKHNNNTFHDLSCNATAKDARVLLQSGFPGLSLDSNTLLSPALQLNGDLAGFDDEQLRAFAEAERIRKHQVSFTSYTIEPDNRLCVISNNAQSLNNFLNIYGGVLDITPLLIKGSHPDYSEVTEFTISTDNSRYRVEYSSRSPVDSHKCTYCGLCGKLCPEACISEKLFFDFDKCTFCRECEKVCPSGAVDIYAVEEHILEIPALLTLGDTKVELPANSQNFYHEATINQYLSTLFASQVDEVITCDPAICQFSSRSRSGCDLCIHACPFDAISGDEQILIDGLKCQECGRCAGICPTGAIQYRRFDDQMFFEFFRTFPLKKQSIVVFGSEKELHSFWWHHHGTTFDNHLFLEYPCTSALSALHLISLLAHGASQVIILKADADDNPFAQKCIDQVNRLVETVFDTSSRVTATTIQGYLSPGPGNENSPLLSKNYTDLNYSNRRQKLSSIFEHALSNLGKTVTVQNDEDTLFHSIICDEEKCTQCLACLNECKIGALSADPSSLTLSWTGSLCTGCTACVDICPENALSTGSEVVISQSYFQAAIAAQAEPMRCKECGKIFGTKKSFDRVMKILASQKMDHDGHFEFCEDCRVIKLLESE